MPKRERSICVEPGCTKKQRSKGDGFWGTRCQLHHRLRYGGLKPYDKLVLRDLFKNLRCEICGWDKGPCDRHRFDKEKGYVEGNVQVLCPNCHRLKTYGII